MNSFIIFSFWYFFARAILSSSKVKFSKSEILIFFLILYVLSLNLPFFSMKTIEESSLIFEYVLNLNLCLIFNPSIFD